MVYVPVSANNGHFIRLGVQDPKTIHKSRLNLPFDSFDSHSIHVFFNHNFQLRYAIISDNEIKAHNMEIKYL